MSWQTKLSWDLESVYPGGPLSPVFTTALGEAEVTVESLVSQADGLGAPGTDNGWPEVLLALQEVEQDLDQLYSFAACHAAANADDADAVNAEAKTHALWTRLERAWSTPHQQICRTDSASLDRLMSSAQLSDLAPRIEDLRAGAPLLLPPGEQELYTELSDSALHGWNQLYSSVSGRLRVNVGEDEALSQGQAHNRLESPDRQTRHHTLHAMQTAWSEVEDLCAGSLSNITHTRMVANRRLQLDELDRPLIEGRIERGTLTGLIGACRSARPVLWRFLAAKAKLLGSDTLHWADLSAPVGEASDTLSFGAAQQLVVDQFARFSSDMAHFAVQAFEGQWVEAEDRVGKRHGAFCTDLPRTRQSRVFMTFSGRIGNVVTLAHELGHAYHNHVLFDLPVARRRVTHNLAETASTFAEALVRSAALEQANTPANRLALLDAELSAATTFLLNIPVRFDFERALFSLRAKGPLRASALSDTMQQLQREWYGPALGETHPLLWAEKIHFYLSGAPFYNFPYTFGYLFSGLVYAHAQNQGAQWADGYIKLLRDTGFGPAESAAKTHLGLNLRDPTSWRPAVERIEALVEQYETLAARVA